MEEISVLAKWLEAAGPYGLVAALAWAFWKVNEKKDAALRELYEEIATLSRTQTEAVFKVEAALAALKDTLSDLVRRQRSGAAE
jgi:hypothetical protein